MKCREAEGSVARLHPQSRGGQTVCMWENRQYRRMRYLEWSVKQHVGLGRYAQQRVKGLGWSLYGSRSSMWLAKEGQHLSVSSGPTHSPGWGRNERCQIKMAA